MTPAVTSRTFTQPIHSGRVLVCLQVVDMAFERVGSFLARLLLSLIEDDA